MFRGSFPPELLHRPANCFSHGSHLSLGHSACSGPLGIPHPFLFTPVLHVLVSTSFMTFFPQSTTPVSPQTQDLSTEFQPDVSWQALCRPLHSHVHSQTAPSLRVASVSPALLSHQISHCDFLPYAQSAKNHQASNLKYSHPSVLCVCGEPIDSRTPPGIQVPYLNCTGCSYHL